MVKRQVTHAYYFCLEKHNLLLQLQTFQLWVSTSTALNTSLQVLHSAGTTLVTPFRSGSCVAREEGLQFFNLLGLTVLSIEVSAREVLVSPFRASPL